MNPQLRLMSLISDLPDVNASSVVNLVVGPSDHPVAFRKAFENLCTQAVLMADFDNPPPGPSAIHFEKRPFFSFAKECACGNMKNILSFPDDKTRFNSVAVAQIGPVIGLRSDIDGYQHALFFNAQAGYFCKT